MPVMIRIMDSYYLCLFANWMCSKQFYSLWESNYVKQMFISYLQGKLVSAYCSIFLHLMWFCKLPYRKVLYQNMNNKNDTD